MFDRMLVPSNVIGLARCVICLLHFYYAFSLFNTTKKQLCVCSVHTTHEFGINAIDSGYLYGCFGCCSQASLTGHIHVIAYSCDLGLYARVLVCVWDWDKYTVAADGSRWTIWCLSKFAMQIITVQKQQFEAMPYRLCMKWASILLLDGWIWLTFIIKLQTVCSHVAMQNKWFYFSMQFSIKLHLIRNVDECCLFACKYLRRECLPFIRLRK